MAGDWIKLETTTPDKPEVFQIAELLEIDPDAVLGKLCRVWIWADQQTTNGNAVSVTRALLDRLTGAPGFAAAMLGAGWLVATDAGVTFPNFESHNGKTAKARALTAKRVARHKSKGNGVGVTSPLPERYPSVTASVTSPLPREEKRREEKSKDTKAEDSSEPPKPAAHEPVTAAAPASPPLLLFPCVGSGAKEWPLTAEKVAEWAEAYPGVDVPAEARKSRQWLIDNPSRRKTYAGMTKFLSAWLSRSQNNARAPAAGQQQFKTAAEKQRDEIEKSILFALEIPDA